MLPGMKKPKGIPKMMKYPQRVDKIGKLNPRTPNMFGGRVMKGAMQDRDMDGFPKAIDCDDSNPRKQGERWDKFKGWVGKQVGETKEGLRRTVAPTKEERQERHETRMERLQQRKAEMKEKQEIGEMRYGMRKQKTELGMQRVKLMKEKQKAMPKMPSMGFGIGVSEKIKEKPTIMTGAPMGIGVPTKVRKPKRRKQKRKKKKYKVTRIEA